MVSVNMIAYLKYGIVPRHRQIDINNILSGPPQEFHEGFIKPVLVNDNMREFLKYANLGLSDPENSNSAPLNNVLSVVCNGLATRDILTKIFVLYTFVNRNMVHGRYLSSTPLMDKYFENTFISIPNFNPKNFRYSRLQTIISKNLIPTNQMTSDQINTINNTDLTDRLDAESYFLATISLYYRMKFKENKK